MTDKHGNLIEDRIYTGADMNRKLVLEKRDDAVVAERSPNT
jgi:type I restriction enzyme R subunit